MPKTHCALSEKAVVMAYKGITVVTLVRCDSKKDNKNIISGNNSKSILAGYGKSSQFLFI